MPRKAKISEELKPILTKEKIVAAQAEADKPKKRSQAWKGLEYAIATAFRTAGFLKAKRILKNEQILAASQHKELPDVNVPEAPFLKLDGKHSQRSWDKVEALFLECQAKYQLAKEDRFAMITQKANSRTRMVHLTLEFFAELCAKAYLGGKSSDCWNCPSCKSEALVTAPSGMGQELHRCDVCCLEFITPEGKRPK
jgi:hypothetical protein